MIKAQKDKIQADIQDYNRTGTPQRVTDYFLSDKATKGADASALADLLVRQDQLKDAGTGGVLPGVDKGIAKNLKQTRGSQGFGASSAFSDAQNTSAKPVVSITRHHTQPAAVISAFFTTDKNEKKYEL